MPRNSIEIINENALPDSYVLDEIRQVEKEKNRTVIKAEFLDNGDGTSTQRFWFKPVGFDRIRRITGYLVGTLDRFNDAKRHEVEDRVKHTTSALPDTGCECTEGR